MRDAFYQRDSRRVVELSKSLHFQQGFFGWMSHVIKISKARILNETLDAIRQGTRNVVLSGLDLDDDDIKDWSQNIGHCRIQSLDISNNRIGPLGAESLAQGLGSTFVQALNLSHNHIGSEGLTFICENLLSRGTLSSLDVTSNSIDNVRSLGNQIGDQTLNLRFLFLKGNDLSANGILVLTENQSNSVASFTFV